MKILHTVEFYSPSIGGAQEVVRQISERLVTAGHAVTVATTRTQGRPQATINGVRIEEFDISGNAVRGYKGDVDRYGKFLLAGEFDLMMNYAAQQWTTDLAFQVLDRLPYRKVLAPCGFSGLHNPAYARYFQRMPAILKQYDRLIVHSDITRDASFIKEHGLNHYSIITNGASTEEFREPVRNFRMSHDIAPDVPMLLTVGSHTGWKGHSLVMEGFRQAKIGPAVLVIIGNTLGGAGCLWKCRLHAAFVRMGSGGSKRVLLCNPPREDVVAAYQAADLFVFGSNIECSPLVLFEATAAGTAFVSADVGNSREIARWTGGGVIVPVQAHRGGAVVARAGDMARVIEEMLSNSSKRTAMAEAGREAWKKRFTWDRITSQYEDVYHALLSQT